MNTIANAANTTEKIHRITNETTLTAITKEARNNSMTFCQMYKLTE